MKHVFLDTVGMIAIWDQSDQWHGQATHVYQQLIEGQFVPVTTVYVLAECANAAARRPYRNQASRLCQRLEAAGTLMSPTRHEWSQAWQAYARGEAAQAGIVDHISFQMMRRLGIHEVFSNDHHFRAAGFTTLF